MKRLVSVLVIGVSLLLAGSVRAELGDGMEGTVWKYRPKGIINWFCFWNRDYLVFQSGNFMKAELSDRGYAPSLYTATKTGYGIKWTAVLTSPKSPEVDWDGLRVSYWMTGTFKGDGQTTRWKAWQIFPKPKKEETATAPVAPVPTAPAPAVPAPVTPAPTAPTSNSPVPNPPAP